MKTAKILTAKILAAWVKTENDSRDTASAVERLRKQQAAEKNAAVRLTVRAIWHESQEVYRIGAHGHSLVSADGNEWFINFVGGEYAEGGLFDMAEIVLVGGPRDGVSVG